MGSARRTRVALLVCALGSLALASAAGARLKVLVLKTGNRTDSNRTARTIDGVVIHATEGRFLGSVRWLRNPRSHGSAHFVVSRRGQIVQLVSVTDVAWHAGNGRWNRHSIGIEHEGWTRRGGFTEAQYRASAQLVAYLSHRYGIPLDRTHVIGHDEVPNPYVRGLYGGVDGHTDPGRHWKWAHYMALIHRDARHPKQPRYVRRMRIAPSPAPPSIAPGAAARTIRPSVVDRGATVKGNALWWSGIDASRRWRRHIHKVDFLVDGRRLWTDHTWPFAFRGGRGWNTRTVANGRHMLAIRAYGRRGYRVRKRIPLRVTNPPMQLSIAGASHGSGLLGLATIGVRADEPVRRVALYVDGRPVSRDGDAPYNLRWDTTTTTDGPHELLIYARGVGGRRAAEQIPVVVANAGDVPVSLRLAWGASLARAAVDAAGLTDSR